MVTAEKKLENGELQKVEDRFEFRGAKPTDGDALKQFYSSCERLIAVARNCMTTLGIKTDVISYNVTVATLTGEIVSADQTAKERVKAEKDAKEAAEKSAKVNEDAETAEKTAAESGSAAARKKAEKARKKANDLKAKADEAAKKLEAPAPSNMSAPQSESSALTKAEETPDSAPSA
ncbi:MAG: hypothetical protein AB9869_37590 [Verrucomicrobiia bacterium]